MGVGAIVHQPPAATVHEHGKGCPDAPFVDSDETEGLSVPGDHSVVLVVSRTGQRFGDPKIARAFLGGVEAGAMPCD